MLIKNINFIESKIENPTHSFRKRNLVLHRNLSKILKTPFYIEHLWWLLLWVFTWNFFCEIRKYSKKKDIRANKKYLQELDKVTVKLALWVLRNWFSRCNESSSCSDCSNLALLVTFLSIINSSPNKVLSPFFGENQMDNGDVWKKGIKSDLKLCMNSSVTALYSFTKMELFFNSFWKGTCIASFSYHDSIWLLGKASFTT